jgi:protein ImuA
LGLINHSFPNGVFPFAALHEFICHNTEEAAAASGFVAGMLSPLMQKGGAAIWIGTRCRIFPPALHAFHLPPHQVIFLDVKKEKEVAWAMEEALRCNALAAVVGELPEMSFMASRRFQLAIEQSKVACFVLRVKPKNRATTAVTRWQITPVVSKLEEGMPGVGYPRWQVNLLKVRNGKPGTWEVEWANGGFRHASKLALIQHQWQKRTG